MLRVTGCCLFLMACGNAGGPILGEKVQESEQGWSVPNHACLKGESSTVSNDDGTISQFCTMAGRTVDRFVRWHPNGQKATEGRYLDGDRHGTWVWWHDNSQLSARGEYVTGQPRGMWSWWHPNGQLETQGDHLTGNRMGEWRSWYPTGQMKAVGQYRNDSKNGTWRVYTTEGELARTENWDLGRLRSHKALIDGWEIEDPSP